MLIRLLDCPGFIHETALILYVYLPQSWNGEDSCLTVSSHCYVVAMPLLRFPWLVLHQFLCGLIYQKPHLSPEDLGKVRAPKLR